MGLISTDLLRPGMVTASDVQDKSQRMILGKGNEISERHIRIFKTWGVGMVDVVVEGEDAAGGVQGKSIDPGALDAARKEAENLFRYADRNEPVIGHLLELCVQAIARAK